MKVSPLLLTATLLAALFLFFSSTELNADSGLIGYWTFDEGSGNIINDQTANANNGTIVNGSGMPINGVFVPGISGTALYLDGNTEVQFGVPNNLSPVTAITLEAWYSGVPFYGTGNDPIIDRGYYSHTLPAYQYHLGVCGTDYGAPNNGGFLFCTGNNDEYNRLGTIVPGAWVPGPWYHVVGTWDGAVQKLYVNGIMLNQKATVGPLPDYGQPMKFGGFDNLPYKLYGTIDEIRIYDRALSADEVVQHYNHPTPEQLIIRIEKTHNTIQGNYVEVPIIKSFGSIPMGGFDFLIAYDASALSFSTAQLGADLGPAGCGWEYFTFRYGSQGNCGGPCPSGMLRVVAIADANNGANHPACFAVADGAELVILKFYVTNDRTFECQYVPIRFAWIDCGDNGISSVTGDTLYISEKVFEFQNTDPESDPSYEITGIDCDFPIHYGGACNGCDNSLKYQPVHNILYWNGGVDIACADSIDAPGDLNLNDIAYEIADAVLYTNYFLYGLTALDSNPQFREAQIAASDANQDGSVLTVGDLVYLLRVIVGDALPYAKLTPFADDVQVSFANGILSTETSLEIGGIYATFRVTGEHAINNATSMNLSSAQDSDLLKILVYSGLEDMSKKMAPGHNDILAISGEVELVSIEIADYNGNMLRPNLCKDALPSEFSLLQNSPNPFNPSTKIDLMLPTATDWSLDIYNVAGQLIRSYNGRGVGNVTIEWDASGQPSGVYLYKATAGSKTESRKMLLLK